MHSPPDTTTLLLTGHDIERVVMDYGLDRTVRALVDRLERTMRSLDAERTAMPARDGFSYGHPHPGLIEWMPIFETGREVVVKLVGYHPENPAAYGLPTILSTVSAYDTATGHLSCVMDGVLPTALRTAAATVVASRLLARPDARTLGVIGCGAQAVAHVHALSLYYDFDRILAYDTRPGAATSLGARCAPLLEVLPPIEVRPPDELVPECDMLLTATSVGIGAGPLFEHVTTRQHLHVNAVGSDFPGKVELPVSLLRNSYVCPDFLDQATVEGECQQLNREEIGHDIVRLLKEPRLCGGLADRRTVYDSTGWSLQDRATLRLFTELATERGLGRRIEIENTRGQADNPYEFIGATAAQNT